MNKVKRITQYDNTYEKLSADRKLACDYFYEKRGCFSCPFFVEEPLYNEDGVINDSFDSCNIDIDKYWSEEVKLLGENFWNE